MKLRVTTRWQSEGANLDARLPALLRAVANQGSLNRAVATLQLSYRHAWGILLATERLLGQPLVLMERGRGARLSSLAERLLAADSAAQDSLERELGATLKALNEGAAQPRRSLRHKVLMIHASHDLALAGLRDFLAESGRAVPDLRFRGSLECLASLARGECDIAGFHLPEASAEAAAFAPYRPWLRTRDLRLVRFVTRRQGLMVAPGNPRRLRTLKDLAATGASFVNRQPESGTRLAFDHLLAGANLRASQINGYRMEEFTHGAVAATVAAGSADAGFGIEAAARQHGLDFVHLATERYFLAARARTLARTDVQALLEQVKGPGFLERLDGLAGYDAAGIGEVVAAQEPLPRS